MYKMKSNLGVLRTRIILLTSLCCFLLVCHASALDQLKPKKNPEIRSFEYKIKKDILWRYDKTTRPVKDDATTITTNVAISLYHILDTNEKEQTFTCLLAIRTRWKDEYLKWDKDKFGNVSTIRIPADKIWTPDLVISNFAGDKFNDYMITNTIVQHDGSVLWLYPALIKTYCTLNVKYFPFDSQQCEIVFISWTFSGFELDIVYNKTFENIVYYVPENQEWRVDGITAVRHEKKYACCEEPYPDVTFTIHMRRGSLFYIVNLITPCFLIFMISFLGFFLPVESGEKVNLETTILLALVVFLLMVTETMPPTPDAIPILGMFFGCTMLLVTIALFMAVVVTNIYGKKDSFESCPRWVVRLAFKFFPRYLKNFPPHGSESEMCPVKRFRKTSSNGSRPGDIMSITECHRGGEAESLTADGCCGTCKVMDDSQDYHPSSHHYGRHDSSSHTSHRDRRKSFSVPQPSFDHERNDAEWRMVAKFADRVLFWVYFVLSMATQTVLFMQMVPEPPKNLDDVS